MATTNQLTEVGTALSAIYASLDSFDHPALHRTHLWDLAQFSVSIGLAQHVDDDAVRSAISSVYNEYQEEVLPTASALPCSVIMGDCNDANIIMRAGSVAGLIDFSDAVHTWSVNEVAIAMAYALITSFGQLQPYLALAALLFGYVQNRRLSEEELRVLPVLIATRLSISISVGAYSISKEPENEYLKLHALPARKALLLLRSTESRKHEDFFREVQDAAVINSESTDEHLKKSREELGRRNAEKTATRDRVVSEFTAQYTSVWNLAQKEGVTLGRCSAVTPPPVQLRDSLPGIDEETQSACWPVLLLYPQYNTLDIIQAAGGTDMLVEHLAVILPEKGDYEQPIEWDRDDEYQASNVVVYAALHSAQKVVSQQQWVDDCLEHRMIVSGDTTTAPLVESKGLLGHSHVVLEDVKKGAVQREQQFQTIQANLHAKQANHVSYFEVHLGCTITQILRSPGHVAAGGILSLIVFPKDNAAHRRFLKGCKDEGLRIAPLNPV
eukprot:gene21428-27458_t